MLTGLVIYLEIIFILEFGIESKPAAETPNPFTFGKDTETVFNFSAVTTAQPQEESQEPKKISNSY